MSVTLAEVFQFPPARRSFIIREEFIGICALSPSPHCAGAILSVMDRWTRFRAEERQKIQRDNLARSQNNQPEEKLPTFWIFMSIEQYSREMLYLFGERTIRDSLNWLCEERLLVRRKNPNNGFDKVYQYRMMRARIQYAIDAYARYDFFFDPGFSTASKRKKRRPEAAKLPVRRGRIARTPQSPPQESASHSHSTGEDAAENQKQKSAPLEEVPAQTAAREIGEPDAPVPPAVLSGLGMPGEAAVARQDRQAAEYRKVKRSLLYQAFAQAWADSLPEMSEAERESLIPALRPDNATRHLSTIAQLQLMKATPDHVRTVVLAKREKGKSEYPFWWLPDDVQSLIVSEADINNGDVPPVVEAPVGGPRIHEISEDDRVRYAAVLGDRPTLPGVKANMR